MRKHAILSSVPCPCADEKCTNGLMKYWGICALQHWLCEKSGGGCGSGSGVIKRILKGIKKRQEQVPHQERRKGKRAKREEKVSEKKNQNA